MQSLWLAFGFHAGSLIQKLQPLRCPFHRSRGGMDLTRDAVMLLCPAMRMIVKASTPHFPWPSQHCMAQRVKDQIPGGIRLR